MTCLIVDNGISVNPLSVGGIGGEGVSVTVVGVVVGVGATVFLGALAAASMSLATTLPPNPDPSPTCDKGIFFSLASFFAYGDAMTHPPIVFCGVGAGSSIRKEKRG